MDTPNQKTNQKQTKPFFIPLSGLFLKKKRKKSHNSVFNLFLRILNKIWLVHLMFLRGYYGFPGAYWPLTNYEQ